MKIRIMSVLFLSFFFFFFFSYEETSCFLPVLIPVTGNGRVDDLGWCRLFKCTVVKTDCVSLIATQLQ